MIARPSSSQGTRPLPMHLLTWALFLMSSTNLDWQDQKLRDELCSGTRRIGQSFAMLEGKTVTVMVDLQREIEMGTAVKKGILKPIRYISQMFDQKETEMQIGFPTDVKHVAHIGSDGPNTSDPGWMKDYHSAPLNPTCVTPERDSAAANTWGSQGSDFLSEGIEDSAAVDGGADSTKPRHSRRHKSDDTPDMAAAAAADSADGGAKKSRRGRKKEAAAAGATPADVPAIPKKSHRRRSKDEGSVRSSKSKAEPSAKSDAAEEKNSAPSAAAGSGS